MSSASVVRTARRWIGFHLARIPDVVVERVTARHPVAIAGQRLEPRTQHALQLLHRTSTPLHRLPVPVARREYLEFSRVFDDPPLPLPRVTDRTIPGPGGPMKVRSYCPPGAASPGPALVYFHGGGGVIGNLDTHDVLCRRICRELSAQVIAVDYRLAPEHPFPAAVDDAVAAVAWVIEHAPRLGILPDRVAVGGDSMGGNLSAVLCQRARDEGRAMPVAQLLLYPATEMVTPTESRRAFNDGFLLDQPTIDWFMDHYLGDADRSDPRISPLLHPDLSGLPPAVMVTAGFDPLRDEGRAYADAMQEAGGRVVYRCHDGLIHGFAQMTGAVEPALRAIEDACAELSAMMRGS